MWNRSYAPRRWERPYDGQVRRAAVWLAATAALLASALLAALRVGEAHGALSNWQALALGVVQGLTELLPISSSGHLALMPWLLDWEFLTENREFGHTFDVGLHLGTLVAVVAYFWRDVATLAVAWLRSVRRRGVDDADERLAWLIVLATIPAVVVGAIAGGAVEGELGEPWQIATALAAFALLLYWADRTRQRRGIRGVGPRSALIIGVAQIAALVPGVSRSGVTITAARFLGLERDAAARFSFLLLIPVTFGALVYKAVTDVVLGDLPPGVWGPFAVGSIASAASALVAIEALLGYVRRRDYSIFVVYRLAAAALIFGLIVTGVRPASF